MSTKNGGSDQSQSFNDPPESSGKDILREEDIKSWKLANGRPWLYRWESPVGEFQIRAVEGRDVKVVWELRVQGENSRGEFIDTELSAYTDPTEAMLAVCEKTTGFFRWDSYSGPADLPLNSSDWEEVTRRP